MTSLGWALYEIDGLNMNITQKDVPSWAPIELNTDFFAVILPDLFFFCPNCPIKFVVVSPSWPNITLSSTSGGSVSYMTNVGWYVYQHHSETWEFAFSMFVEIAGSLSLWINDENMRIYGDVTAQKVLFTEDQSVIGAVNLELMQLIVNRFLDKGVGPIANGEHPLFNLDFVFAHHFLFSRYPQQYWHPSPFSSSWYGLGWPTNRVFRRFCHCRI
jgi:hypothetical protein